MKNFHRADWVWKSPYNALQTLGHWLRHVCHTGPSYYYLATRHLHLATIFYQLLSIGPIPKKLAPKTSLQGPLWPPSKIFWLKHWLWLMKEVFRALYINNWENSPLIGVIYVTIFPSGAIESDEAEQDDLVPDCEVHAKVSIWYHHPQPQKQCGNPKIRNLQNSLSR